jgi:hypothetical protein
MCFSVRSGLITGRQHIVYGVNCQDSLKVKTFHHNADTYYIGVVADGCGEGTRSEVGAHLATSFLINRTEDLVKREVATEEIPQRLFNDLVGFLKTIVAGFSTQDTPPTSIVQFIKNHLLFTVLGFVISPETTVTFAMGDGVILLNDVIDIRDENNHPMYIAYHLVDDDFLEETRSPLPKKFDLQIIPTKLLEKLAVGTDAWESELGVLFSIWDEKVCKSVQRTMNVLSKKEKRFKDDAAIVTVMRQREVVNESESGQ